LAPYIPNNLVSLFSAAGIAAFRLDTHDAGVLKGQRTIALPAPAQWPEMRSTAVRVGGATLPLTWLARGAERAWVTGGMGAAGTEKRAVASKVRRSSADEA
jgi:aconitate hydratase